MWRIDFGGGHLWAHCSSREKMAAGAWLRFCRLFTAQGTSLEVTWKVKSCPCSACQQTAWCQAVKARRKDTFSQTWTRALWACSSPVVDRGGENGLGERWMDLGYILKVEWTGLTDGLYIGVYKWTLRTLRLLQRRGRTRREEHDNLDILILKCYWQPSKNVR